MRTFHHLVGAGLFAFGLATPAWAEPRLTIISQWSAGAEGAAMNAFGELDTKAGVKWEHNPVSGFTTDMMNKLRADIIAGRPPAASQLRVRKSAAGPPSRQRSTSTAWWSAPITRR